MEKACDITGPYGSMLTFARSSTAAPTSDRHHLSVARDEPTPARMIGPTLRSRFHRDELTLRAWFSGPPRVDLPQ